MNSIEALRNALVKCSADIVLVDVTQGIDLYEIGHVAKAQPHVALVALGLTEQRQEVVRCGRAGFSGYISREATVDAVRTAMADIVAGRQTCSSEIASGLLRALFRYDWTPCPSPDQESLTRRECDVLRLIGEGLTNKEIARTLNLSVATVKHHVHNILDKLSVPRRAQAMQQVHKMPWLALVERVASTNARSGMSHSD
ncbi:response regulator transcription factor [Paraburkholderia sp. BL27I4N3]|uniref:response regulator transcription factor n=1 Tax=Paraburkholderia sp. BL27I4N3 TaxID=1938805 RepID=UPI002161FFDD|nr:response regulator transcription factor [Paraburkholderia sp. BL27I4N3]